jgi:hypothetical protein
MCHAILVVKHRTGDSSQVKCEKDTDMQARLDALMALEETLEVRVFVSAHKLVRRTTWEQQP